MNTKLLTILDNVRRTNSKDREMRREKAKADKRKEKQINKFYKKIGLDQNASQDEKNQKILDYARDNVFVEGVYLNDIQKNDPVFLMKLFKANHLLLEESYISADLKNNVGFMLDFLKLKVEKRKSRNNGKNLDNFDFMCEINAFGDLKKSLNFWIGLGERFPECNLLGLLEMNIRKTTVFDSEEKFKNFVEKLPKYLLVGQARRHGYYSVKRIPKSNPYFLDALAAAVEKDGFNSLSLLARDEILPNRHLIVKAAEVCGIEGLVDFFENDLSVDREEVYMCHEELHVSHYTDLKYLPIQKELIEDDALFDAIKLPEDEKKKFREFTSDKIKYCYEKIKPFNQRSEETEVVKQDKPFLTFDE